MSSGTYSNLQNPSKRLIANSDAKSKKKICEKAVSKSKKSIKIKHHKENFQKK